jgi:hypothetical protein
MTAAVAMTEATERSRPRTRMTKVWPITTTASGASCISMLVMLEPLRNAGLIAAVTRIARTRNR